MASTMARAVKSVSVACTSSGAIVARQAVLEPVAGGRARARCSSAAARRGRARRSKRSSEVRVGRARARPSGRPRRSARRDACAPIRRAARCRDRNRSPAVLPGAGSHVTLLMPPMLTTARERCGCAEHRFVERRNERRALAAGGHVAAAEIGDHVDAGQLGEPRRDRSAGSVKPRSGRWRTVWPWQPMAAIGCARHAAAGDHALDRARIELGELDGHRPARSSESLPGSQSARMRSRSASGKATVANASVRGEPAEKSTSAASAPSRLVPDMRPTNSRPRDAHAIRSARRCAALTRSMVARASPATASNCARRLRGDGLRLGQARRASDPGACPRS